MSIEATLIRFTTQVIHALAEADKDVSVAHARRDSKRKRQVAHDDATSAAADSARTPADGTGKFVEHDGLNAGRQRRAALLVHSIYQ